MSRECHTLGCEKLAKKVQQEVSAEHMVLLCGDCASDTARDIEELGGAVDIVRDCLNCDRVVNWFVNERCPSCGHEQELIQ